MSIGAGAEFLAGSIIAKLALDKSGWTGSVSSALKDGQNLTGMSGSVAASFTNIGKMMAVAGAAIIGALSGCIKEASEFGSVTRQLDAVLASTNGTAGLTKEAVLDMAESLQYVTKFSDTAIIGGQNLLLTFTNIGRDVFPQATETMLDMSTALGQDLKSSAIQLGKALQDPVLGVTALRRVGVNFDKDAQKMIKTLVEQNRSLDAQKVILAELANEFGGSARKAAEGFSGQIQVVKNILNETQKEIGLALMPSLKEMVGKIKEVAFEIMEWVKAHPQLVAAIAKAALALGAFLTVGGTLLVLIPKIIGIFGALFNLIVSGNILWVAAIAMIARYVILLYELRDANNYATEATERFNKANEDLTGKLHGLVTAGKLTEDEFAALQEKYHGNAAALAMAIKQGKEGVDLQTALAKVGSEHSKALEEQEKNSKKLTNGLKELGVEVSNVKVEIAETAIGSMALLSKSVSDFLLNEVDLGGYLRREGIKTLQDKASEVRALEQKIRILDQAYKDGMISLKDYMRLTEEARGKIKDLSTDIGITAVPAARDMSFAFDVASETVQEFNEQGLTFPGAHKTATTEVKNYWKDMIESVKSGWTNLLKDFFDGGMTLKDFLKGLWDNIKNSFAQMVAEMIVNWVFNFIGGLVSTATTASSTVSTVIGGAISSIGSAISGLVSGIKEIAKAILEIIELIAKTIIDIVAYGIETLATAIANAINALAAAAPALLELGLVAAAIYTAFKLGEALVGAIGNIIGGGSQTDVTYWLKFIKDNSQIAADWIKVLGTWLLTEVWPVLLEIKDYSKDSRDLLRGIETIVAFLESIYSVAKDMRDALDKLAGISKSSSSSSASSSGYYSIAGSSTVISSSPSPAVPVKVEISPILIPSEKGTIVDFMTKQIWIGNVPVPASAVFHG